MYDVKITVVYKADYKELQKQYENPIEHACNLALNDCFISKDAQIPDGFCQSAWRSVYEFVFALACGATDFYDGWMQNKHSAMISCNDGFRPVSFLLERIE